MRSSATWKRTLGGLMAVGLILAACGDDDGDSDSASTEAPAVSEAVDEAETAATDVAEEEDTASTEAVEEAETAATDAMEEEETAATDAAASGEELPLEGEVEVATGTVLNLDECPDDWSAVTGVDGDEIRVGQSLPQSGPAAAFGPIGEGIQMYFDFINDTDPIDDKELVLVTRDDAYEAGRAVANVQEMLDTDDIFSFMYMIGTPINFATRDITAEACVPQLFNGSGFPLWGDPANYPWTVGGILDYTTETGIWCQDIVDTVGEGAKVSALIMNNDFGLTYQQALEQCEADGLITLGEVQLHDQAAPDVTNEMTTIIADQADAFVASTTGAFCPQSLATVAASEWRPTFYMSYTCNNLAAFIQPVQDQAAQLAEDGSGVRMANSNKVCGDPAFDDDPWVVQTREILDEYGSVGCEDGSFSTGVLFGELIVDLFREAAALPGGLNRVNLMSALWNWETTSDGLLGGTLKLDGVNDAYLTEAAQVQEIVVEDGALTFNPVSDILDFEGEGGSYAG